jgi:hypothetical protein
LPHFLHVITTLEKIASMQQQTEIRKLNMIGKTAGFQRITVRPESVEGQTVDLGSSPYTIDRASSLGFFNLREDLLPRIHVQEYLDQKADPEGDCGDS